MSGEEQIIRDTIRAFRGKEIEALWEELNAPTRDPYVTLWEGLAEVGVPLMGLPESEGGLGLGALPCFDLLCEIGRGCPALGVGVLQHVNALSRLPRLPSVLSEAAAEARVAYVGNPLDAAGETPYRIRRNGKLVIKGCGRVALAYAEWLVVPAMDGDVRKLVVVEAGSTGVSFDGRASSHGLRLIEFGELRLTDVTVEEGRLLDAGDGVAAAQQADGLLAALLTGAITQMAEGAMAYAIERYQGGKMIHEHDAVQQLVAPLLLAARAGRTLALDALSPAGRRAGTGDGGASAFLVGEARKGGLDAIQTYGGYGYTEDYRAERYMRDVNTLETFFVHGDKRSRAIARARFAEMKG